MEDRAERYQLSRVTEGDIETREDIPTAQEVKTYSEPWRETNRSIKRYRSNLDSQTMDVHRDQPAITNGDKRFFTLMVVQTKTSRLIQREDRNKGSRIHVGLYLDPSQWPFDTDADDWARNSSVGFIGKTYRAHKKS